MYSDTFNHYTVLGNFCKLFQKFYELLDHFFSYLITEYNENCSRYSTIQYFTKFMLKIFCFSNGEQ